MRFFPGNLTRNCIDKKNITVIESKALTIFLRRDPENDPEGNLRARRGYFLPAFGCYDPGRSKNLPVRLKIFLVFSSLTSDEV